MSRKIAVSKPVGPGRRPTVVNKRPTEHKCGAEIQFIVFLQADNISSEPITSGANAAPQNLWGMVRV